MPVATIGATINPAVGGVGIISSTLGEFDGIYKNEPTVETGRRGASVVLDVDDATYANVKAWATSQVGEQYNYGLFTDACNHFVQRAYELAGFTGGYGAQFSFENVLDHTGFIWSGIQDAPEYVLGLQKWRTVDPQTGDVSYVDGPLYRPPTECFLAGTPIDMWPGADGKAWQKPIEDIRPDDWVVSYDEDGKLVPGRVSRTMQNRVKHILDVHGLMMTPGHVTYCAKVEGEDNKFGDSHVPVLDILRSDGAMMKKDGSLIRASTGAPVGSLEDRKIWAVSGPKIGNQITVADKGQIRLGTRFIMEDGSVLSVLDMIARMGAMLNQDGVLVYNMSDKAGFVFHWEHTPMLPKPEDYVLQRSALTLNDIYAVDEWEAVRPRMPAPVTGESGPSFPRRSDVHYAASPRGEDVRPPNIPLSMRNHPNQPTMSRQQRRALKRKQQKAQTSAAKRAQKAKRAATLH
ncbi:MAG: Hint domain-containing protein [Ahrensia sp.]|nr:Hint domain-containing protein [Ahrensia sp.]